MGDALAFALANATWKHWVFTLGLIAIVYSLMVFFDDGSAERKQQQYIQYMKECVPKMAANRCREIYNYTMKEEYNN